MKLKQVIIPVLIITIFVISILIVFIFRLKNSEKLLPDSVPSTEISISQVMQHSTNVDCWVAIGGSVYRLDSYFVKNPDQALSAQLCGKVEPEVVLPTNLKKSSLLAYRIGVLAP
jgi:hypothetical protein